MELDGITDHLEIVIGRMPPNWEDDRVGDGTERPVPWTAASGVVEPEDRLVVRGLRGRGYPTGGTGAGDDESSTGVVDRGVPSVVGSR